MPRDLRDLLEYTNDENLQRIADALEAIAETQVAERLLVEREKLRLHMIEQTTDERDTYAAGYASGLVVGIRHIDDALGRELLIRP